jgi:uncharacterized protein YbcI
MNKFRIGVKMKDHSDKSKKEVSDILIKYFKEQVGDKPYKIGFLKNMTVTQSMVERLKSYERKRSCALGEDTQSNYK